ncbi:MAG TPA: bifunctional metallophosphatase/5'-nucleotidase [Saprospiraceae bacterium]|nr:bifunctional metallophosphatase/5'-nucleotidase [Saprospiraceae bacterium]
MKQLLSLFFFSLLLFLTSCTGTKKGVKSHDDNQLDFVVLAMNDVYEIDALSGGTVGGMARVATVRKELLSENPNTFTLHAGDCLNPSLLGNLKYEGKKIKGRQMVEVMNQCGIDWMVPGNHEFDLKRDELQARINESNFNWVVANAQENMDDGSKKPFHKDLPKGDKEYFPKYTEWNVTDKDGTTIRIGIVAATIPFDVKKYATITNPFDAVGDVLKEMEDCDVIIGLTHLNWADDVKLANKYPQIDLIIGGHDHYNMLKKTKHANVTKADANARTVYVHRFHVDKKTHQVTISSQLKDVDTSVEFDPLTQKIVEKWEKIGKNAVKKAGIDPDKVIATLDRPLDGREIAIRDHATGLGKLIAKSMLAASEKGATSAIFNSGSVRLDDYLEGDITGTDIMRVLPYGGPIFDVEMDGDLFKKVLDAGRANRGKGGYLQHANISYNDKEQKWSINGKPLQENKKYRVVATSYMLQGREGGLEFLNPKNPKLKIFDHDMESNLEDIRKAMASYLARK